MRDIGELEIGQQETIYLVLTTQLPTTQITLFLILNIIYIISFF